MSPPRTLHQHPTGKDRAGVVPSTWAGQLCHQPRGQQHGTETIWLQEQPFQTDAKGWGEAARDEPRGAAQAVGNRMGRLSPPLWAGPAWRVRGSRAGTFSRVPGPAPAHRQALRYVLVIRLQVQLPLHLQGIGVIIKNSHCHGPTAPPVLDTEGGCQGPPRDSPRGTAGYSSPRSRQGSVDRSSCYTHQRGHRGLTPPRGAPPGCEKHPKAGVGLRRGRQSAAQRPGVRLPEQQLGKGRARQVSAAWHRTVWNGTAGQGIEHGMAQPSRVQQVVSWHSTE